MNSEKKHVYLDTQYLHAYIFPKKKGYNKKKHAEEDKICFDQFSYLFNCKEKNLILKIPFVVLGEILNNISRKRLDNRQKQDIIHKYMNLINSKKIDFVPGSRNCFEITNKLLNEENRLDPTDTLIIAQAISDIDSTHVLFNDAKILNSGAIAKVIESYPNRNYNLKLTDKYRK